MNDKLSIDEAREQLDELVRRVHMNGESFAIYFDKTHIFPGAALVPRALQQVWEATRDEGFELTIATWSKIIGHETTDDEMMAWVVMMVDEVRQEKRLEAANAAKE